MRGMRGNRLVMWVLNLMVSTCQTGYTDKYEQYLGDEGDTGDVGEYFGDVGDMCAAGEAKLTSQFHHVTKHRTYLTWRIW